jgi:hypothetical protein
MNVFMPNTSMMQLYTAQVFTDLINVEGYHVSEHVTGGPGGEVILTSTL